jgi:farnesyl diphosphate synthase
MSAATEHSPFEDWARTVQAHIEEALGAFLPAPDTIPCKLHEAMRYTVLGGGKRVRPLLVFAGGALFGADPRAL